VRALVTGITGFAGTHLAEHLLAQGDAVLGAAQAQGWLEDVPHQLPRKVPLVTWDLGHPQGLSPDAKREIERFAPDAVYHLAAISIPSVCGDDQPTPQAMAVNVEGTRAVLDLAATLASRPRVLFISSSKVYSREQAGVEPLCEDAPLDPYNGYGRSKLIAEGVVQEAVQSGLHGIIARSFQHAGPRQDARLMLSEWARQFAAGSTAPVRIRTRQAQLELSDVRDIVRAYRLLILHGEAGAAYNVGSGIVRSSGEIFDLLHGMADPERPVEEGHGRTIYEPIADISRLQRATAWRPEIPLQQTVADTWEYWRTQMAGATETSPAKPPAEG